MQLVKVSAGCGDPLLPPPLPPSLTLSLSPTFHMTIASVRDHRAVSGRRDVLNPLYTIRYPPWTIYGKHSAKWMYKAVSQYHQDTSHCVVSWYSNAGNSGDLPWWY
jgi:hypothetical protein